jgi:hypothetical protein
LPSEWLGRAEGNPVVRGARDAEAETGLVAVAEAHVDLPRHPFGSCSICTRRLHALAKQDAPDGGR